MKLAVIADLHWDFWYDTGVDPLSEIEDSIADADAIYLAGDLTNKGNKRWRMVFEWLQKRFDMKKFYAFPGNHDCYQFRIDREDRLAEQCAEFGVTYAQMASHVFEDTRVLSCTLWTDFNLYGDQARGMRDAKDVMNDYVNIRVEKTGFMRLTPRYVLEHLHRPQLAWLKAELSKPFDGQTVVLTHHAPSPSALLSRFTNKDHINPSYASDLDNFILDMKPDAWLFGHTHEEAEFTVGNTYLRNCSIGYPEVSLTSRHKSRVPSDASRYVLDTDHLKLRLKPSNK